MKDEYFSQHWIDGDGNPSGGVSSGTGVCISWQNGPLSVGGLRRGPNGAFVETVLDMVADRIEFYEQSRFASEYNKKALFHIGAALAALNQRTADREARGVEGTHKE